MAIEVDVEQTDFGVSFTAAYMRIFRVEISRREYFNEKHTVLIDIHGYATAPTDPLTDLRDIQQRRYAAPLSVIESEDGDDFLAKCYNWVMKQPDMNGAIAV